MKNDGEMITFLKSKEYKMIKNDLGQGSFGKTVLLQDPFINELFVAKKYEPQIEGLKERFYDNFVSEIKILYKLNHSNIVRIFNYNIFKKRYTGYILMEYIEGYTIDDYFIRFKKGDVKCKTSIDFIFIQLIDAFSYIEDKGIIHRDIREKNIMIDHTGVVKVIDFGIGKSEVRENDTAAMKDSMVSDIQRPSLLPSEYQQRIYTSQTDMFYLGELIQRLIKNNELENGFSYEAIIKKMMEINPNDRYTTFMEIKKALSDKKMEAREFDNNSKEVYQRFSTLFFSSLTKLWDSTELVEDVGDFLENLQDVLNSHLMEDYINSEFVIETIVKGKYAYKTQYFSRSDVDIFFNWLIGLNQEDRKIIFANFIYKFKTLPRVQTYDLPF